MRRAGPGRRARTDVLGDLGPRARRDVGAHPAAAPGRARRGLDGGGRTASGGLVDYAPDEGSLVRIEARRSEGEVRAFLRPGAGGWVEAVCPNGEGEYVWTRKRADVPVECDIRARRAPLAGRGARDGGRVGRLSPRHTVWSWSAGVGRTGDGRSVGWNLVSGINDPPQRSERAIWVDGEPFEPGPVELRGPGGDRLRRRVAARVQRRVRAAKAGEPPPRPLHVPSALRPLLGHASGRHNARARPRRHGAPRRSLVGR